MKTLTELLARTDRSGDCWLWLGAISSNGYGHYSDEGHTISAHRGIYELATAPVPDGLQLDHLCRVRRCVNPAHLEPVTCSTNIRRGLTGNRTACAQGHSYNEANTRLDRKGHRYCAACRLAKVRAHRAKCVKCSTRPETYAKMFPAPEAEPGFPPQQSDEM